MGFARRKRSSVKGGVYAFLIVISLIIIGGSTYLMIDSRINLIKSSYAGRLEQFEIDVQLNTKSIYIPIDDIPSGTVITEALVMETSVLTEIDNMLFMTEEDFGQYNLIDLSAGEPIMHYVLAEEVIPDDLRIQEFTVFHLPSHLSSNHYVDVRLSLPNGEDYIVLSKKQVKSLDVESNALWLWLSEKELLEVSSAIVDAFLHEGSMIYTTVYVEPELQQAAIATYPVNRDVLLLIQENPNILDEAKASLSIEARMALEARLQGVFETDISTGDDLEITDEIEGSSTQSEIEDTTVETAEDQEVDSDEEVINSDAFFD